MRLIQFVDGAGGRKVAAFDPEQSQRTHFTVKSCLSTRQLALDAWRSGRTLIQEVRARGYEDTVDIAALSAGGRLLAPLDHQDQSRTVVSITGLTHLGSAKSRDQMHKALASGALTDSMRMFQIGLEGGKPLEGETGAQPEWAWKGDGQCVRAPGEPIEMFPFGDDLGEEAEIVGLYVIADDGSVLRLGYALGNEFSDHVLEKQNYLYLAHSKLRPCAIGPELRVGDLPREIEGQVSVLRNGDTVWSSAFLSGEDNMCHAVSNLEDHHFKYPIFRRPGDVHIHFLGASVLSFSDGLSLRDGDIVEISAPDFGHPLASPVRSAQHPPTKIIAM